METLEGLACKDMTSCLTFLHWKYQDFSLHLHQYPFSFSINALFAMVQRPVCQKEFGSSQYFTLHFQQTQWLNAMHGLHPCQEKKNSDRKVFATTLLESTNEETHSPHVNQKFQIEIYKCPLPINVAGDIVFLDNDNFDGT